MTQATSKPSSPMQVPATWDAVAAGYAEQITHHAEYAEEALRVAPIGASDRVLDVGAGPGTFALVAAARAAHVTAIDFSPAMIEQLKARAADAGVSNVQAMVMDAQSLTLPDGAFDAAFSLFAFMFVPDRARAFRELHRVLRPGGRAVVLTWGPIDRRPLMKIGFDALAEAMPDMPPPQKGDLQQTDECIRELTAAGFRDVESHAFTAAMHFDSPDDYLTMILRTSAPVPMLQKRLGEREWGAVVDRMRQAVRRRIPESGVDLPAEAMVTSGTR
jgi:ubiquinone/menaquinone biosynthesis C-methylase UbiE